MEAATMTQAVHDSVGVKPLGHLEVWFAVGSQELYGEEALRQVDAHAVEIAASLDAAGVIPVRVVAKPVLRDADSIKALALAANGDPRCIGVVVWMHTFSPAKMWIAGLTALAKPLLHLHTQYNRDLPWAEIDMDFMNLNQAAHGDREFAHVATRLRLRRKTVVGHWSESRVLERIGTWSRAAAGFHTLQTMRVARFGDNMRQVAVTEGDKVAAQMQLGLTVDGYGISSLENAVDAVGEADVDDLVARYLELYDVVAGLRPRGVRHASLRDAARIELGLRTFLADGSFTAFTDTFEDLGRLRQLPGIAVQRLMAEGYGFGGEGDWKTAALVRVTNVMAAGLPGGTSFMEDYTYHLAPGAAQVLGAHMLEVSPSITTRRPRCEIHPLSIGGRADPVRLVFTADPGQGVVVGLLDLGARFRMVLNEIDVIEPGDDLPNLPVARALWRPAPDFETAAEGWLAAGGPHHTVYTTSLGTEAFEDLAEIAGVELVVIDRDSTRRSVRNELRWNDAAYERARPFG
jgi:L-arabinose isomerase